MKLSNKILIGFFGLIFIYMTAVFTEFKLRGTPYTYTIKSYVTDSVTVEDYTQQYKDQGFSIDLLPDCQIAKKDDKHVEISVPSVEGTLSVFWPRHGESLEFESKELELKYKDLKVDHMNLRDMSDYLFKYESKANEVSRDITLGPIYLEEDEKFILIIAKTFHAESRTYLLHFIGTDNEHMMKAKGMLNTFKVIEPAI